MRGVEGSGAWCGVARCVLRGGAVRGAEGRGAWCGGAWCMVRRAEVHGAEGGCSRTTSIAGAFDSVSAVDGRSRTNWPESDEPIKIVNGF